MAEEKPSSTFLLTERPAELMRRYSVPCIISLLVAALYNIVDQIFIANASYLGSAGNAANTVVYPLTVVALSLAVMVGDGCCAYVSLCLGSGRTEDAHRSVGNAIVLCAAVSLLLTAVHYLCMPALLHAFGGDVSPQTYAYSVEYFTWIAAGIPFYMLGQALNPIIRSDGNPKFAMKAILAGCITNLVLDPVFIFLFRWGMLGAALATVLGQVLTAALSVWYLFHLKTVRLARNSFRPDFRLIRRFLPLGITSFLSQIAIVASMLAIQNMVVRCGSQDPIFGQEEYAQIPMAVLGIVMKVFQIVISIVVGMAAGTIPVAGYNRGAGRKDRCLALFRLLLRWEAMVGLIALVIVEVFPRALIGIFGAAQESPYYTEFAVRCFRVYLCMIVLACINKACFIYLQALGDARSSSVLSLVREILFGVGLALLLPLWFGLDGVLYSMPASDLLTFVLSVFVISSTVKKLRTPEEKRGKEVQKTQNLSAAV